MRTEQIEEEFKKIRYELISNKPDFVPYPPNIVKRRELLLYAQVTLSNILGAKLKKDKKSEDFQESLYKIIVSSYYNWV